MREGRAARPERAALEVLVSGRVQGVGFREFCVRVAARRGVVGYAMNLSDGRVRVVAEGERAALEALVGDLEQGPRLARVDGIVVAWGPSSEQFTEFAIRYTGEA